MKKNIISFLMIPVFLIVLSVSEIVISFASSILIKIWWMNPVPTTEQVYYSLITIFDDFNIFGRFHMLFFSSTLYIIAGIIAPLYVTYSIINHYVAGTFENNFFFYLNFYFIPLLFHIFILWFLQYQLSLIFYSIIWYFILIFSIFLYVF